MAVEYNRKVNQTGNSITVSIPAEIVKSLDIKKGEDVSVIFDPPANEFIVKKKSALPKGIDMDFLHVLDGVLSDYEPALKNLKDR